MIILTIGIIIFNKVEKVSWIQFKSDGSNLHELPQNWKLIMKQLAIQAENISKWNRPGEVGTGHITWFKSILSKIRGKEDPI
jgi:hypothetical protein